MYGSVVTPQSSRAFASVAEQWLPLAPLLSKAFLTIRMYSGILRAFGRKRKPMPRQIESDWFSGSIPDNVLLGPDVYVDSTFGLAAFFSERNPGRRVGRASGLYDRATLIVGPQGAIDI